MLYLYIENTNVAVLTGVKSSTSTDFDDGAVISITLMDGAGAPVAGQAWPAVMYNEPGGTYSATLDDTLEVLLNHTYTAIVDGVGSAGEVMHIQESVKAINRGDSC